MMNELICGAGYKIFPIPNMDAMEEIKNEFIKILNNNNCNKDINKFRYDLIAKKNSEINELMIKLLGFNRASYLMMKACREIIIELCGDKIFLQRRANIIMNLPGDEQRHQWPHYELMSGISPYTYVIWAPLHDLDDDGGVFYINKNESRDIMMEEIKRGVVNSPWMFKLFENNKPLKMKYGEAIIFNPFIIHGNIPFVSEKARIACSIRVQNVNLPLMQRNSDFFKVISTNK